MKRLFVDEHGASSSKRVRRSSSLSPTKMTHLRSMFPNLETQFIEKAVKECSDLEMAIKFCQQSSLCSSKEWVNAFVGEMSKEFNIDHARVSVMIEYFQKLIENKGVESIQSMQKEILLLKEQFNGVLEENKALKQLVTQYQEQLRNLQMNNDAMSFLLQSSSFPGRF